MRLTQDLRCSGDEVPGLSPKSPDMVVGPMLVIVEPASTEKLEVVPSSTVAVAPSALPAKSSPGDKAGAERSGAHRPGMPR